MPTEHDTKSYKRKQQPKTTIIAEHTGQHVLFHGPTAPVTEAAQAAGVPHRFDNTALAVVVSRHAADHVIDRLEDAGHTVEHADHP